MLCTSLNENRCSEARMCGQGQQEHLLHLKASIIFVLLSCLQSLAPAQLRNPNEHERVLRCDCCDLDTCKYR